MIEPTAWGNVRLILVRALKACCGGLMLVLGAWGCGCAKRDTTQAALPGLRDAALGQPPPRPSLSFSDHGWPAELATDARWMNAAAGDTWSVLQISAQATTQQLLRRVRAGGAAARVAVLAYPLTDQAWARRAQLCEIVPDYAERDWPVLFEALANSGQMQDRFGEPLDVQAAIRCQQVFERLAPQVAQLGEETVDLYESARQVLASERTAL